LDPGVGRLTFLGVTTLDPHFLAPFSSGRQPMADSRQYRPPTPVLCAVPVPTRAATRFLTGSSLPNACPACSGLSAPIVAAPPVGGLLRTQKRPLRCRCSSAEWFTRNPVRRARRVRETTGAERTEARTTLPLSSRPSGRV